MIYTVIVSLNDGMFLAFSYANKDGSNFENPKSKCKKLLLISSYCYLLLLLKGPRSQIKWFLAWSKMEKSWAILRSVHSTALDIQITNHLFVLQVFMVKLCLKLSRISGLFALAKRVMDMLNQSSIVLLEIS